MIASKALELLLASVVDNEETIVPPNLYDELQKWVIIIMDVVSSSKPIPCVGGWYINSIEIRDSDISSDAYEIVVIFKSTQDVIKSEHRDLVLGIVRDVVSNLLYYDRKDCDRLSVKDINTFVQRGDVTIDQMVGEFRSELEKWEKEL